MCFLCKTSEDLEFLFLCEATNANDVVCGDSEKSASRELTRSL